MGSARGMQRFVVVVDRPLRVVCELGEGAFESFEFAHLGRALRHLGQLGVFHCPGTILFSGEHIRSFLRGSFREESLHLTTIPEQSWSLLNFVPLRFEDSTFNIAAIWTLEDKVFNSFLVRGHTRQIHWG